MTNNPELAAWIEAVAAATTPDKIHLVDGSDAEHDKLIEEMLADGTLEKLNEKTHPNCFLHRSDPSDVARVEHLTFVCTHNAEDAGPNNNWMAPDEGHAKVDALFAGCMAGRTMYVIPYLMGPYGSPFARAGVEITDSTYVVANMRIMARIGRRSLDHIEAGNSFVRGLHFRRRSRSGKAFHYAFPRRAHDQEFRIRLRRQRVVGQKVSRVADRKLAGTHRRLVGRAYADPRH